MHKDEKFKEPEYYIPKILETWKNRNIKPKFHVSEQGEGKIGHHSDYIEVIPEYLLEIPEKYFIEIDIMIEAKMKEQAIFKLYKKYTFLDLKKNEILCEEIEEQPLPEWVKKHAKHLIPPVSPELQARFDEGNQFEPYAEALFPNLIRLGFSNFQNYLNLPFETQQAWDDDATVVAQGRYESGSITCISDIVRKDVTEYILTEIKSSTRKKEDHIYDLAFQRVVLEASGFPVKKCEIGHVNSNYVRNGKIDPKSLVAFTDVTEEVQKKMDKALGRTKILEDAE